LLETNKALPYFRKAGQIFLAGARQARSPLNKWSLYRKEMAQGLNAFKLSLLSYQI